MDQVLVFSVIRACELALLAVGLTMVFGAVRFPNVANVEFATFGAYGAILATSAAGLGLFPSAALSIASVGVGAVLLYRFVLRRLIRQSAAMALIGSFAVSIVLRALLQTIAGPDPQQFDVGLERGVAIGGALVTPSQLRLVAITVAVLGGLMLALRFTPLGRSIRAVSTNPDLASAAGINTPFVVYGVWFIAGGLGALAGILLALDTTASIDMGFNLLLPVFAVAVLGGLGSPGGAILAAFTLALVESAVLEVDWGALVGASSYLLPVDYRAAVSFVLLVVLLLVRPQGLMGREVRRA